MFVPISEEEEILNPNKELNIYDIYDAIIIDSSLNEKSQRYKILTLVNNLNGVDFEIITMKDGIELPLGEIVKQIRFMVFPDPMKFGMISSLSYEEKMDAILKMVKFANKYYGSNIIVRKNPLDPYDQSLRPLSELMDDLYLVFDKIDFNLWKDITLVNYNLEKTINHLIEQKKDLFRKEKRKLGNIGKTMSNLKDFSEKDSRVKQINDSLNYLISKRFITQDLLKKITNNKKTFINERTVEKILKKNNINDKITFDLFNLILKHGLLVADRYNCSECNVEYPDHFKHPIKDGGEVKYKFGDFIVYSTEIISYLKNQLNKKSYSNKKERENYLTFLNNFINELNKNLHYKNNLNDETVSVIYKVFDLPSRPTVFEEIIDELIKEPSKELEPETVPTENIELLNNEFDKIKTDFENFKSSISEGTELSKEQTTNIDNIVNNFENFNEKFNKFSKDKSEETIKDLSVKISELINKISELPQPENI